MNKKFVSTMRKGFQMTFENGYTASVQWGAGNYCDNHFPDDIDDFYCKRDMESDTAEVAVFYNGDFADIAEFLHEDACHDGTVCGYLSPEEVLDFLCAVKNASKVNAETIKM